MNWLRRAAVVTAGVLAVVGLAVPTSMGAAAAPTGDVATATVPRPPFDPGVGDPITRTVFTSPDGAASCRRVYTEMIWLECLLRDSNEILRFGPDEFWTDVPCVSPHQSEMCRLGFGWVGIRPASKAATARFAGHAAFPSSGSSNWADAPLPIRCASPIPTSGSAARWGWTTLSASRSTSVWQEASGSCPGYEYIDDETAIPTGHDRCRVIRP